MASRKPSAKLPAKPVAATTPRPSGYARRKLAGKTSIQIGLEPADLDAIKTAAAKLHMPAAVWARSVLLQEAEDVIERY